MKIIHVANFHSKKNGRAYYFTDRKITNGFIRANHFVYDFSYRDEARNLSFWRRQNLGAKKMNAKLLSICKHIVPDVVILGKGELISCDTLEMIKGSIPNVKIGLWHVDAVYNEREIGYISKQLDVIDALFITSGGKSLDRLRRVHPGKVFFFPNPVDASIDRLKVFKNEYFENDVIYCGRDYKRPDRREYLQKIVNLAGEGVKFSLHGVLGEDLIDGDIYFEMLNLSPMALNLSDRFDIDYYSSDRVAQLTGNGLCVLSPVVPHFEKLYSPDEIVYYSGIDSLVSSIEYLKRNPKKMREIARAGWVRAHQDYSSARIAQYFVDVLMRDLTFDYHWADY